MFRYRCPHCTKLLQAPEVRAGKATVCPKCSQALTIPADKADWLNERGEPLLASPTVVIRTPAPGLVVDPPPPPAPRPDADADVLGALVAGDISPATGRLPNDFDLDVRSPPGMSSEINALLGKSDPDFGAPLPRAAVRRRTAASPGGVAAGRGRGADPAPPRADQDAHPAAPRPPPPRDRPTRPAPGPAHAAAADPPGAADRPAAVRPAGVALRPRRPGVGTGPAAAARRRGPDPPPRRLRGGSPSSTPRPAGPTPTSRSS
jgi:hypothetical protein